MKEIYFVTSSTRKVEDYNRRFEPLGYKIIQMKEDMNEGRSLNIEEIAKTKLAQAKKIANGSPVFVEDRGFFVPALKGFPGPFIKIFLGSIGVEGLLKLMAGQDDRQASFVSVLGYWDGAKEHYFYDKEDGFITEDIRVGNLRGWTDLLYVYGHKTVEGKALCEINDNEWDTYLKEVEKNDYIEQFLGFLRNRE